MNVAARASEAVTRWVLFSLDAGRYALPLDSVERVIHAAEVTPLPLAPDEVAPALRVLRDEHPGAWNEWGATDGVNLEGDEPWYAEPRYGLNKGATALRGAAALGRPRK